VNVALFFLVATQLAPATNYDRSPFLQSSAVVNQQAYDEADDNEDGEVTPAEVLDMVEDVMHEERANAPGPVAMMIHGVMPMAVQQCDMNRDGNIDRSEAAHVMGRMPSIVTNIVASASGINAGDHDQFVEVQNRVKNEFKDAVLDLALKNHRNSSVSKEECFGNCYSRCQWLLDQQNCVDICNQGCETEAKLFNPMEHIQKMQHVQYGENEKNYTMVMEKPGLKVETLKVEVRDHVLVVRGEATQEMPNLKINNQFMHTAPIPRDVHIEEITSEVNDDTISVYLPKVSKIEE